MCIKSLNVKGTEFNYLLGNEHLESVNTTKDLGFIFTQNLASTNIILYNKSTAAAKGKFGMLFRNCNEFRYK